MMNDRLASPTELIVRLIDAEAEMVRVARGARQRRELDGVRCRAAQERVDKALDNLRNSVRPWDAEV